MNEKELDLNVTKAGKELRKSNGKTEGERELASLSLALSLGQRVTKAAAFSTPPNRQDSPRN